MSFSPSSINQYPKSTSQGPKPFYDQTEFEAYVAPLRDAGYTHVPVVCETLADLDTPVSTYLKLAVQPI